MFFPTQIKGKVLELMSGCRYCKCPICLGFFRALPGCFDALLHFLSASCALLYSLDSEQLDLFFMRSDMFHLLTTLIFFLFAVNDSILISIANVKFDFAHEDC